MCVCGASLGKIEEGGANRGAEKQNKIGSERRERSERSEARSDKVAYEKRAESKETAYSSAENKGRSSVAYVVVGASRIGK
jgi:hypothetical protein